MTAEVAARVAGILRRERANLLLKYDARGGYGHRDHVHVHHVARAAAHATGVPLAEVSAPRETLVRMLRIADRFMTLPNDFHPEHWLDAFTPRAQITHRVGVHRHLAAKRAAMAAHVSQTQGSFNRALKMILGLPAPVFRLAFGYEYFTDPRRAKTPGEKWRTDLLDLCADSPLTTGTP